MPVDEDGNPDVEQQKAIASAVKRFDTLRTRILDLGIRSSKARAV